MKLLPLDTPGIIELAAGWLACKENHQWLDFGNGRQPITPALLRIIERLGFRFVGRQRQCHSIDGRPYDRLLFDLLASEHRELDDERWHRIGKSHRNALYEER